MSSPSSSVVDVKDNETEMCAVTWHVDPPQIDVASPRSVCSLISNHITTSEMLSSPSRPPPSPTASLSSRSSTPSRSRSNTATDDATSHYTKSLSHAFSSIAVPFISESADNNGVVLKPMSSWSNRFKSVVSWIGVGLLISVGYMDPGNWQTDLSGGASFGYTLLSVILISNIIAVILQQLSLKLGVATERDLAQMCHIAYDKRLCVFLWITTEIAIIATDLAEVVGSAVALQLLFGLSLPIGCAVTCADVLVIMLIDQRSFRYIEVFIGLCTFFMLGCFIYELAVSPIVWSSVFYGFVPQSTIVTNSDALFNAVGILGATVMPHNLFLHSSVVQTRAYPRTVEGKRWAIQYASYDSFVSLTLAFFMNASILIIAAAAFFNTEYNWVASINDAYTLLSPTVGNSAASLIFALALLASGQQSTLTGTLAGQIVMEGFVQFKLPSYQRRLITRLLAVVPAVIVTAVLGSDSVANVLIISQVILSLQLIFTVVPLVHITTSRHYMGDEFVNSWTMTVVAIIVATIIAALNLYLVYAFAADPSSALTGS